jgi:hypothetical protein
LLSAYDHAALLLRRGHTGKIHLVSRSGLTPRTYPPDHLHRVVSLPVPQLCGDGYEGREHLVRRFADEWKRACAVVARQHPEAPAVISERVAKAWEPHLPETLARIPTADLRALLDRYGSLLATLRVGAVPYTTEIVDTAMADGQVVVVTGTVDRIVGTEAGTLVLSVSGPAGTRTVEADLVISNFGREPDYGRVRSVLWANLLRKGIAVPHSRTGRGVEVDGSGALAGRAGTVPVWVVGGPREGDEIMRHGRMGAFAFNLAAIKNHSTGVAAAVLRRLESCYDEEAEGLADTLPHAPDHAAFAHAVMLEVRRMASRRRRDREAVALRLEASLASIRGGLRMTDRALRSAVNTAATRKLNDLSVTPRDLRRLLGLDEQREPID